MHQHRRVLVAISKRAADAQLLSRRRELTLVHVVCLSLLCMFLHPGICTVFCVSFLFCVRAIPCLKTVAPNKEECAANKVDLAYRDYCAHKLVPLNKCRCVRVV